MRFLLFLVLVRFGRTDYSDLLHGTMVALEKGLQFMENEIANINLDGALGCQLVEIALDSLVQYRSELLDRLNLREHIVSLSFRARRIVEESKHYLRAKQPQYYADIGRLLDMSDVIFWHPERVTDPTLQVAPVSCEEAGFNESRSDQCLSEVIGRKSDPETCKLTKECWEIMTQPRQRGYYITHQVIFLQLAEMKNCSELTKFFQKNPPSQLQNVLCSNIMQESTKIAESNYPVSHQDLFMEQIGVCGMWGYKDFFKTEWLKQIIQWQSKIGCYKNHVHWKCTDYPQKHEKRTKRQEKELKNGCLSHKTAVAIFALATNIRFNLEKVYETLYDSK